MSFFRRSSRAPKVGGEIGYHGLADWWLSNFTEEERNYIESRYKPLGLGTTNERPLTQGTNSWSSGRAAQFLSGLSTNFQGPKDRHIARRLLIKAEQVSGSTILDRHFVYSEMIQVYYRDRDNDPNSLDEAIRACEKQIEIGPEAVQAWRAEYPTDAELPAHRGFTQLAIIREKERNYAEAIRLAKEAMEQGWAGDWDTRIARCETRISSS
jgi:tetratricopeptide (TPR) repeat protein